MQQIRQTAYKIWISNVINSVFINSIGEWEPNYIEFSGIKVSRVNVIATVVDKFKSNDGTHASITLDDGTGTIRARAFRDDIKLIEDINIGNIVNVIGRLREYQQEIYIIPEIVKSVDSNFEVLRKLELFKEIGRPKKREQVITAEGHIEKEENVEVKEEVAISSSDSKRQKILNLIENYSEIGGANINVVVRESGFSEEEANSIIEELLKEGEIYENKPGYLKTI